MRGQGGMKEKNTCGHLRKIRRERVEEDTQAFRNPAGREDDLPLRRGFPQLVRQRFLLVLQPVAERKHKRCR